MRMALDAQGGRSWAGLAAQCCLITKAPLAPPAADSLIVGSEGSRVPGSEPAHLPPAPGGWGLSQCRLLEPMLASPFRVLFWVIVLGSPQHWWEHRGTGLPDSLPTSQQLLGAQCQSRKLRAARTVVLGQQRCPRLCPRFLWGWSRPCPAPGCVARPLLGGTGDRSPRTGPLCSRKQSDQP